MTDTNSLEIIFIVTLCIILSVKLNEAAVFFPTNSAYGIFAAIAVPLDLPNRNVFLSYNFEANYNLPFTWDIPPIAAGIEDEDLFVSRQCANCTLSENSSSSMEDNNATESTEATDAVDVDTPTENITTESTESTTARSKKTKKKKRQPRSLLSRTHFYHILMDKFRRSGYEGESCLLRLICETNSSDLGDINGILGNLIHIIFSPSTSVYEELPLAYYQAELDGVHEQCVHYEKDCKKNLLDLISMPLIDIVKNMLPNK